VPAEHPARCNKLDRFDIDYALCMYCGHLRRGVPVRRAVLEPEYEYSEPRIADLLHDKDKLASGWRPSRSSPSSRRAPTRRRASECWLSDDVLVARTSPSGSSPR
jgi:formate hydrogenlyase subunit 6/NADH:ubiquinone oxidoreductase subunit I